MSAIARPSREMRSVGTLKARELATAMTPWGDCGPQAVCAPVDERHGNDWAFFLSDRRVRLRKREALFRPGDCASALYLLRVGFIMTMMPTPDGAEHVLGFHLPGELVGLEGMGKDAHTCNALALEDSEVCMLPILGIYKVAREDMLFQQHLYRMLSCAIVEERRVALMLGTMRAEQRVASFLLDLGTRYGKCGYSSTAYLLRMTRADIGSHLGLKLETCQPAVVALCGGRTDWRKWTGDSAAQPDRNGTARDQFGTNWPTTMVPMATAARGRRTRRSRCRQRIKRLRTASRCVGFHFP